MIINAQHRTPLCQVTSRQEIFDQKKAKDILDRFERAETLLSGLNNTEHDACPDSNKVVLSEYKTKGKLRQALFHTASLLIALPTLGMGPIVLEQLLGPQEEVNGLATYDESGKTNSIDLVREEKLCWSLFNPLCDAEVEVYKKDTLEDGSTQYHLSDSGGPFRNELKGTVLERDGKLSLISKED